MRHARRKRAAVLARLQEKRGSRGDEKGAIGGSIVRCGKVALFVSAVAVVLADQSTLGVVARRLVLVILSSVI
jgi:hypothetical protein